MNICVAGSVEAMSASYRTIRSNKEVDVRAKRSKFKNKKKNSSTSKSATGPVAQLISIKPSEFESLESYKWLTYKAIFLSLMSFAVHLCF